jgi:hypothetical protein
MLGLLGSLSEKPKYFWFEPWDPCILKRKVMGHFHVGFCAPLHCSLHVGDDMSCFETTSPYWSCRMQSARKRIRINLRLSNHYSLREGLIMGKRDIVILLSKSTMITNRNNQRSVFALHSTGSPRTHQTTRPKNTQGQHRREKKISQTTTPIQPPSQLTHLLPFFPPALTAPLLPAIATGTPRNPSPFSAPQAAQSASILTVAQISPLEHARCTRAADGQKAAKTVLVWPQGCVWA